MDPLLPVLLLMVWLSGVMMGFALCAVVMRRIRRRQLLRSPVLLRALRGLRQS